jgi:FkbM family methyltransferase
MEIPGEKSHLRRTASFSSDPNELPDPTALLCASLCPRIRLTPDIGRTLMASREHTVTTFDYFLRAVAQLRFLPRGIRYRLVQWLRNPDRTPDRRFSVRFFGLTYKGSLANGIDSRVFFFGSYEPEILLLFHKILTGMDSPVVADVGANVGHHSLYLSKLAAQVHSFEPWPNVRTQLLKKLDDNNVRNVKVHAVGLGNQNETKLYYAPEGGNPGTGSFLPTHESARNRPSEHLPIAIGDQYLQQNGIHKLDFIKIDVEGWEWYVLLGLAGTIKRYRPVVLFEYWVSTKMSLRSRSQLDIFPEYELFQVGGKIKFLGRNEIKQVQDEELPMGNLLLIPAEKVESLCARLSRPSFLRTHPLFY